MADRVTDEGRGSGPAQAVRAPGGRIDLTATPGEGSAFAVTLQQPMPRPD